MQQNALKYGTITGVALAGYILFFYYFQKNWLLSTPVQLSALLIYFVGIFAAARADANANFKFVLRSAFLVFLMANAGFYAAEYLVFSQLDPQLDEVRKEMAIGVMRTATPLEQQADTAQNIRDYETYKFTNMLFRYAKGAIGGFILALLATFLVKRNSKN
jgi:hypothetical protein